MKSPEYHVRNMLIKKEVFSKFLGYFKDNEVLKNCSLFQAFPSGLFYIVTIDNVGNDERAFLKINQDIWITGEISDSKRNSKEYNLLVSKERLSKFLEIFSERDDLKKYQIVDTRLFQSHYIISIDNVNPDSYPMFSEIQDKWI